MIVSDVYLFIDNENERKILYFLKAKQRNSIRVEMHDL